MGKLELFIHDHTIALPVLIKTALMLCNSGIQKAPLFYLSLFFKVHRQEYYSLLNEVRSTGDREAWLGYFLEAVTLTSWQAVTTVRQIDRQISNGPEDHRTNRPFLDNDAPYF